MNEAKQNDTDELELENSPTEILDGLTLGLVTNGARQTVSTDRLDAEGVLRLETEDGKSARRSPVTPSRLHELYINGTVYVPEHTPVWEVSEALIQLSDDEQEEDA